MLIGVLARVVLFAATPSPSPAASTTASQTVSPFWDRFVTSAGFGGLMAFLAACIAGAIALAQFRNVKRQQTQGRWWDTLTWVYDRTIVDESNRKPLPQTVTFAMLTVLNAEAAAARKKDRLRGETISSILGIFQPDEPDELPVRHPPDAVERDPKVAEKDPLTHYGAPTLLEPREAPEVRRREQQHQIAVEDAAAGRLLDSLLDDLRSQGYWDAATYEVAVATALVRVIGVPLTQPDSRRRSYTPDFELHAREAYVAFEIKSTSRPISRNELQRWAMSVATSPTFPTMTGALMISTQPLGRRERSYLENEIPAVLPTTRFRYAAWASRANDEDLAGALSSMGVAIQSEHLR